MTFIDFIISFINNFIAESNQELNRSDGAIFKKRIKALQIYINANYLDGTRLSESEFDVYLDDNKIKKDSFFDDFVPIQFYNPFKKAASGQFEDIVNRLSGKVYAINRKELLEITGAKGNEKALQFIFDCFKLTKIEYHFKSFKDINVEILYSNDGLKLDDARVKKYVNTFFSFFIYGDADKKNSNYDSEKYYGCTPVQKNRIISYCKQKSMPQEYIDKLLAIAECSDRFNITENNELYLKKQYLYNNEAYAAAILYENGKPLHKDEIFNRIIKLSQQYPELIDKRESALNYRRERKPIICTSGGQGEWGLQIWKKDCRNVLTVIRDFVYATYANTQQAVPLDQIVEHLKSVGFNYPKPSIKTYVTKSGCKGAGDNTYYPEESEYIGKKYNWRNKQHIICREVAEYLFVNGNSKREDIIKNIVEKYNYPIDKVTLDKALFEYTNLFIKVGNSNAQKIKLSDKITSKLAIKKAFPEPEKQENKDLGKIKKAIIDYLRDNDTALQTNLVMLFKDMLPVYLKFKDTIIRKILDDKNIFVKTRLGEKKIQVTIQPLYLEKLKLNTPAPVAQATPAEAKNFTWKELKDGIIRQMVGKEYDHNLTNYVDKMFYIIKGGNNELLPNSNFASIIPQLYQYVTAPTSLEDRKRLQTDMLMMMEAYCKEFYRIKYGNRLQEKRGLGQVALYLQETGILPDKNKGYLDKPELNIAYTVDRVRNQRNNLVGHAEAFAEQKDKQSISDIHDCLVVMLYLAKQL